MEDAHGLVRRVADALLSHAMATCQQRGRAVPPELALHLDAGVRAVCESLTADAMALRKAPWLWDMLRREVVQPAVDAGFGELATRVMAGPWLSVRESLAATPADPGGLLLAQLRTLSAAVGRLWEAVLSEARSLQESARQTQLAQAILGATASAAGKRCKRGRRVTGERCDKVTLTGGVPVVCRGIARGQYSVLDDGMHLGTRCMCHARYTAQRGMHAMGLACGTSWVVPRVNTVCPGTTQRRPLCTTGKRPQKECRCLVQV